MTSCVLVVVVQEQGFFQARAYGLQHCASCGMLIFKVLGDVVVFVVLADSKGEAGPMGKRLLMILELRCTWGGALPVSPGRCTWGEPCL